LLLIDEAPAVRPASSGRRRRDQALHAAETVKPNTFIAITAKIIQPSGTAPQAM